MPTVDELLFSWDAAPSPLLARVRIEDDSLRDGLQGAFTRHPRLDEKKRLVAMSAAVGSQAAMLGFPASSDHEFAECRALTEFLDTEAIPLVPRFLARAREDDVRPIVSIQAGAAREVWADFFVGCSPLRRAVEQWTLPDLFGRIETTSGFLARAGTPFGVSFEDASRTPPHELSALVRSACDGGARVITVCDTVGASTPRGAAALVTAVMESRDRAGSDVEVWWHGHNDRGLALANALAAAEAGAHTISGSFLGIGERTGNTPLEQVVVFLAQCGHTGYRPDRLAAYCRALAEATGTAVPVNAPLVGAQAFATCTGTHAAAILKARRMGVAFEDYVFSSVPANLLGRQQEVFLGPTSGLAVARHALEQLRIEATTENVGRLLSYSRLRDSWLNGDEIRQLYPEHGGVSAAGGAQ